MTAALKFDAIKTGFRQSKDGIVISFVVHPSADCIPALAVLEIGQECKIELSGPDAAPTVSRPTDETVKGGRSSETSVRAGAKERYAQLNDGEKAVARAVLLCKDATFRTWLGLWFDDPKSLTEDLMRRQLMVTSRSEIATNPDALRRFLALELEFNQSTGRAAKDYIG